MLAPQEVGLPSWRLGLCEIEDEFSRHYAQRVEARRAAGRREDQGEQSAASYVTGFAAIEHKTGRERGMAGRGQCPCWSSPQEGDQMVTCCERPD